LKGVEAMVGKRVLIVDDNAKVRRELRTVLALAGDVEIVGEAEDGREAIRQVEALRPDLVVMDLGMPAMDGSRHQPYQNALPAARHRPDQSQDEQRETASAVAGISRQRAPWIFQYKQ
jgi:DNA-binding NarL/FixJ family response regulator